MERAFVYGDLLFETIKVVNAKPLLVSYHYNRLLAAAQTLNMTLPKGFNFEVFCNQLDKAIQAYTGGNNFTHILRLRYTLYRNSKGFYLPQSNQTDYHIDVFLFEPKPDAAAINLGIYKEQRKASGPLSNIKSGNALVYVMASIWAHNNGFADAIVLNEHHRPIEATASNLFWIKNNTTYTVPLSEGCVAGVYRQYLLDSENITEKFCTVEELLDADEVFITNTLYQKREVKILV